MLSADTSLKLSLGLLISMNRDVNGRNTECLASALILSPSGCTVLTQSLYRSEWQVQWCGQKSSVFAALKTELRVSSFFLLHSNISLETLTVRVLWRETRKLCLGTQVS